jgi:YD repeat-containing protein
MMLKHIQDLTGADLPNIESPVFSVSKVTALFSRFPGHRPIFGIKSYIDSKRLTRHVPDDEACRVICADLEFGHVFLVHLIEKPFRPLFTRKDGSDATGKWDWSVNGFHGPNATFMFNWAITRTEPIGGATDPSFLKLAVAGLPTVAGALSGGAAGAPAGLKGESTAAVEKAVPSKTLVEKNNEGNRNSDNGPGGKVLGDPVNAVTGAVLGTETDFTIDGRLPLAWTRYYSSQNTFMGHYGQGWSSPADIRLEEDDDGAVIFHHGTNSVSVFAHLPAGQSVPDVRKDYYLYETDEGYSVTGKGNITYHFPAETRTRLRYLQRIGDAHGNYLRFVRVGTSADLSFIKSSDGFEFHVINVNSRITLVSRILPDGTDRTLARYEYDRDFGSVSSAADTLGNAITYEYKNGLLTQTTLRNGTTFRYEYDRLDETGRCLRTWGDNGLFDYRFAYDTDHRITRATDSLGHVKTFIYNKNELPVTVRDHSGHETRYTYDEAGRPLSVIGPTGAITRYDYDAKGNLSAVTRPDGAEILMTHDGNGNPIAITDPNGHTWTQEFKNRGALTKRISPLGSFTEYEYSDQGDLSSVTAPNGGVTRFTCDPQGRIVAVTHADGAVESFERDTFGNITAVTDPAGRTTHYAYDDLFRLTTVLKPSGTNIRCEYDESSRLTAYTDEAGNITRLAYTPLGKVKTRTNPDGTEVHYGYDTEERLVTVTNERGEVYRFDRDHDGRITRETDYWGNARTYTYDPAGRLLESVDPLNRITRFTTDTLGRLTEKIFDDGTHETFAFDANGNLIRHENVHSSTERVYDAENRTLTETTGSRTVTHEYDALGNRTRRLSPAGNDIVYRYDLLGRTTGITINGRDIGITRNALGLPVKETFFDGTERTYDYTLDNQLADQTVILPQGGTIRRSYEYDPVGNLTARIDADKGSRYFTYNPMGRITRYTDPEQTVKEFLHDPAGDLLKRTETRTPDGSRFKIGRAHV